MAEVESDAGCRIGEEEDGGKLSRKEKRKLLKKIKRKGKRKDVALKGKEEEEIKMNDPEEQRRIEALEREEIRRIETARIEFEERERLWMERMKKKKEEEEEEARRRMEEQEQLERDQVQDESDDSDGYEYVEEGPAEIIWQGNEIIVKKKKVKVPKKRDKDTSKEEAERPTSNPLPPQSEAYMDSLNAPVLSAQQAYDNLAQQVPSFGTEQDKAHCPFHIKTGVCRFGSRCNRAHFYPNKSCTLLIKNMYSGPGLAWEQDEALEYTEEEVERSFEEFYDDVHTEFLKFGEIINFKVCKNGSAHLRGNVYVHYKLLDSTQLAFHAINGRFFAGKQVKCEYVGVTRWKTAICGEYMKTRLSTCSRGTACNFIHCFRNPGGDYEWADCDKPPPRYWVKKMSALFGYTDDSIDEHRVRSPSQLRNEDSQALTAPSANRFNHLRRPRSRDRESARHITDRNHYEKFDSRNDTQWQKHKYEARRHAARRIVKDLPGRDCTDTVTSSNNNRDPSDTRRSSDCQTRDEGFAFSEDDADHRSRKELHGDDETRCGRPSNRSRHEVVTKDSETRRGRTWNSEVESNENGGGAIDQVKDSCRYDSGRTRQESKVKDRNICTNWDKGKYETTDLVENRDDHLYRDKVEERLSHKHQEEHRDDCKRSDKEKVSFKRMSHYRDVHDDIECSPRKKRRRRRRRSGPARGSYASSPDYADKKKTYCAESSDVHSDDYVQPQSSSPIGQENEAVGIIHDRWDPECVS